MVLRLFSYVPRIAIEIWGFSLIFVIFCLPSVRVERVIMSGTSQWSVFVITEKEKHLEHLSYTISFRLQPCINKLHSPPIMSYFLHGEFILIYLYQ